MCLEGEVWEKIFTKILIEICLEGEILDHFDFALFAYNSSTCHTKMY